MSLISLGFALRHDPVDAPLVTLLNDNHVGTWGQLSNLTYTVLEPVNAIALTLLIAVVVAVVSRSVRIATAFIGTVALTWLPTAAIKLMVGRPRPNATDLAHAFTPAQVDGSFPSGHTAYVTAIGITLWFLLRGTRWSIPAIIVGSVTTVFVALAVISDGLHYPTDVAASILWALAMAPTARWAMTRTLSARWLNQRQLSKP